MPKVKKFLDSKKEVASKIEECPICFEEFKIGESQIVALNCGNTSENDVKNGNNIEINRLSQNSVVPLVREEMLEIPP